LNGCGFAINDEGFKPEPAVKFKPEPAKPKPLVEFMIGDENTFNVTDSRGDTTESFSLVMHVIVRKQDERAFSERYEHCKTDVIDRVAAILHESTTEERREAEHTAIKERVRREINKVLKMPWVNTVLFTHVIHEIN
jgi:hypothetical protein